MKQRLETIVGTDNLLVNEPMAAHTTFRVGGPADYLVTPQGIDQIQQVTAVCREQDIPYMLIGNGSNLLVSDAGYRGVIIQLLDNYREISIQGKGIYAQAGALLSTVARQAQKAGLAGMEFAGGIPGTIGGAMMMNAGAYGGEMKDIVSSVTVMDGEGRLAQYTCEEMAFGYRDSVLAHGELYALEINLALQEGDPEEIAGEMNRLAERRSSKQPLEFPSAGSTFKRPTGHYAGALIEDAGLKGYRLGGAMVSDKHCGFVINADHASAADIRELIEYIQKTVEEHSGVKMTPEVRFVGEF